MKYLPALAGLLSLLACALWISALCGPWYRIHDGTQQHMGLYKSYETGASHQHEHERGHNMFEDAAGITAAREQLAEKHKHDDDEYDHYSKHSHKHQHDDEPQHKHRHKHEEEEEKEDENNVLPTLRPIIIQPTQPDNINGPTTAAPLAPQPTGPSDLQFGGGGSGGGGFGGWGGSGGGGWATKPTPSPTAVPADSVPSEPVATPLPTSKHGHVYRQPHDDKEPKNEYEHGHKHKHKHEQKHQHERDEDDKERYEQMLLNQVNDANIPEQGQGTTQDTEQGYGQGRHMKKHGTKHEIKKTNELPYDETWVQVMRVLLILAIIVSAIAALLQFIMAWTFGNMQYKGSWMTSPTTAILTTTLITLAALHGLIVFLLFMSKRHDLPHHHGHYDYSHTLNIIATGLSFLSPLLFWYTLDPYAKHEGLLGDETMGGGRRKYASVE